MHPPRVDVPLDTIEVSVELPRGRSVVTHEYQTAQLPTLVVGRGLDSYYRVLFTFKGQRTFGEIVMMYL